MSDVRALVTITERGVVIGELFDSESAVVQQNPTWFAPVTKRAVVPVVEAATSAPGEVRQTKPASE